MENPFTGEPQKGRYALFYFWVLGRFSKCTGMDIRVTWDLFRLAGGFLYIVLFWNLTQFYFTDRDRRIYATLIFSLAGGLDWIVVFLRLTLFPFQQLKILGRAFNGHWNWSAFGSMAFAHWIWASLGVVLLCLIARWNHPARHPAMFVVLPVIWFIHPYTGILAYFMIGLYPLMPVLTSPLPGRPIPWHRVLENLRQILPGALSLIPVIGYTLWASADPVYQATSAGSFGNITFPLGWYPLEYGLLLPLAGFGIRSMFSRDSAARDMLFAWLLASFLLSVNPFLVGVKFQYTLFPPLAVFASEGLFYIYDRSEKIRRLAKSPFYAGMFMMLLLMNAPVSVVKNFGNIELNPALYISTEEQAAIKWLESRPDGLVLCSEETGNLIPWLAGKKVYLGHWYLTMDVETKRKDFQNFLSPARSTKDKKEILIRSGAKYIFYGSWESIWGQVDTGLPVREVYRTDHVSIHEVDGGVTEAGRLGSIEPR